jgi:hypothetical protein
MKHTNQINASAGSEKVLTPSVFRISCGPWHKKRKNAHLPKAESRGVTQSRKPYLSVKQDPQPANGQRIWATLVQPDHAFCVTRYLTNV